MVNFPKRRITFNVEGKKFEAKELSARYLMDAALNPEKDTVDAAILDSIGELSEEDHKLFGQDTKEMIYVEIVKFTFKEKLGADERKALGLDLGLSVEEINGLTQDAQVQLRNIAEARKAKSGKATGGQPGKD